MSEPARLANIFFSPSAAFADIARRPSFWVPILLATIAAAAVIASFSNHIGWDALIRKQLEQNSRFQQQGGAQSEQAIQLAERIAPITSYAGAVLGPIIVTLIIALVFMFLFDNIMGAEIGFKRMMAIVAYAGLPRLLYSGLTILVMFLKNPEDFDLRNPLVFNLGVLLPADAPQWQKTLGSQFDLFTLWVLVLCALGICAAARRMKFGKAFAGVLFPWILWVGVVTGVTAAFA